MHPKLRVFPSSKWRTMITPTLPAYADCSQEWRENHLPIFFSVWRCFLTSGSRCVTLRCHYSLGRFRSFFVESEKKGNPDALTRSHTRMRARTLAQLLLFVLLFALSKSAAMARETSVIGGCQATEKWGWSRACHIWRSGCHILFQRWRWLVQNCLQSVNFGSQHEKSGRSRPTVLAWSFVFGFFFIGLFFSIPSFPYFVLRPARGGGGE